MRIRLTGLLFAWDSLRTDRGVDPCHGTPSLDMLGSRGSRSAPDDGRTMPTPWRRSHEPRWRSGSNDAPAGSRERRTATTRGASHGRGPAPTGGGSSHGSSTRDDSGTPARPSTARAASAASSVLRPRRVPRSRCRAPLPSSRHSPFSTSPSDPARGRGATAPGWRDQGRPTTPRRTIPWHGRFSSQRNRPALPRTATTGLSRPGAGACGA